MPDLTPLFRPRAVAVVGASSKPGSFGGQVLQNLQSLGFPGGLYAVHPREKEVLGTPCYPALSAIPERPDCAALAVANRHILPLLEEAADLEIPAVVVFGDPNVGPDRDPGLQEKIARLANRTGLLICGPNAMGVFSRRSRLGISGYPIQTGLPAGDIALITHSGTVFDSLSQNNRGVGFNYLVSGGNEAGLTAADYLKFVLEDPDTKAAALYLETVRDPETFVQALAIAQEKAIPIVVLKTGRSPRGRQLAQAHTGALAGEAAAYEAVFRHYGAIQVHTLDEMMDTLELLNRARSLRSADLSVLMESGGERSMLVDIAGDLGLSLNEFSEETERRLAETLDPGVAPENPLDAFGTGHEVAGVYEGCLRAMDADPGTGLVLMAVDLARHSNLSRLYVEAALRAGPGLENPLIVLVNVSSGAGEGLVAELRANGIPVLMGTETGLRAVRHLIRYDAFRKTIGEPSRPPTHPGPSRIAALRRSVQEASGPIGELAALALLSAYGIPTVQCLPADSLEAAKQAAEAIGYPVALKTAEAGVLHKTERGGVRLDLQDNGMLQEAYLGMKEAIGPRVLLQKMAPGGTEFFFGMSRDPQFGPILYFGFGGIHLELYRDVIAALPGITEPACRRLLKRLRGFPLLEGWRAKPGADLDALAGLMAGFGAFVLDFGDLLEEVDVNPLIFSETGILAVDALLIPLAVQEKRSLDTGE